MTDVAEDGMEAGPTDRETGPEEDVLEEAVGGQSGDPLRDRLRAVGLRPTRQRLTLARLLFAGPHRHVSAEALHREAARTGAGLSLATVYNTLAQFTQAGLLRQVVVEPGRSYFDTNTGHHHHFFHARRGDLIDVANGSVEITKLPDPPAGTRIRRVDVVIRIED